MNTNEHLDELKRIEEKISDGEDTALIARWESGKYLNTLKNGKKQLPKGVRAQCIEELGIGGSEVNARMAFADKYPSPGEVSDAIGKFGSWFRIVREGLTDKPRPKAASQPLTKAARWVAGFKELDPTEMTPELLAEHKADIQRLEAGMKTLGLGRAA